VILICSSSYRIVSTLWIRKAPVRSRSVRDAPTKGTYHPGIGRTSIIQEVSAAAPLRIPCDVFNGESRGDGGGGGLNQCLRTYAEGADDACAPPTGTSNEELPISLKTSRFCERRFRNGRVIRLTKKRATIYSY